MVSSEVVFFPIRPTDSYSSFNWSAMVVPIFSGAIKKSMPWLRFWISFKYLNARSREIGFAPFRTAWRSVFFPSVPFRPTAPPIPAIGLTRKPTLFTLSRLNRFSVERFSTRAPSETCDLLSPSSLPLSLSVFLGRNVEDEVFLP